MSEEQKQIKPFYLSASLIIGSIVLIGYFALMLAGKMAVNNESIGAVFAMVSMILAKQVANKTGWLKPGLVVTESIDKKSENEGKQSEDKKDGQAEE